MMIQYFHITQYATCLFVCFLSLSNFKQISIGTEEQSPPHAKSESSTDAMYFITPLPEQSSTDDMPPQMDTYDVPPPLPSKTYDRPKPSASPQQRPNEPKYHQSACKISRVYKNSVHGVEKLPSPSIYIEEPPEPPPRKESARKPLTQEPQVQKETQFGSSKTNPKPKSHSYEDSLPTSYQSKETTLPEENVPDHQQTGQVSALPDIISPESLQVCVFFN